MRELDAGGTRLCAHYQSDVSTRLELGSSQPYHLTTCNTLLLVGEYTAGSIIIMKMGLPLYRESAV